MAVETPRERATVMREALDRASFDVDLLSLARHEALQSGDIARVARCCVKAHAPVP
ncbi:hypothetical protein [Xanthobacter aminoxidans]|uniref:hypothetical protein n=1 Tax=Xanthobacter aminoxidans TaxID=186280 RepID=UPI002022E18A|nr:hypothetical protein [Xanthobacter aminoxidans]MCL8384272.1 hypothetical protein [Xanthobacter aminoxidans]